MKWSGTDYAFMSRALQFARLGLYSCQPNPRVGCLIVRDGQIVGTGSHLRAGGDHAEVAALREAGDLARGATCYVTLEPCAHTGRTPPCTDALIRAGVGRVVAAMIDPNPKVSGRGMAQLAAAGIMTESGLLESDARRLNPGFIRRMESGMPRVTVKLAISCDGRTALANGRSQWITGEPARADVQRLRASSCAILTGSGTVLIDNPRLSVRGIDTIDRQPLRVVLDRRLRTPASAEIFNHPGRILIMTTSALPEAVAALETAGATVRSLPEPAFLRTVLAVLAREYDINEVLVESGPGVAGGMLAAGLVDQLILYQAASVLGDSARPMVNLPVLEDMQDRFSFRLIGSRHVGDDLRLVYHSGESH